MPSLYIAPPTMFFSSMFRVPPAYLHVDTRAWTTKIAAENFVLHLCCLTTFTLFLSPGLLDKSKFNLLNMDNDIVIKTLSWDHPDACSLRSAQQAEIDVVRPIGPGVPATAANVSVFLVAYRAEEPIACGGLRWLHSEGLHGQAEVKRMYVVPSERGGPVAKQILQALEGKAKENDREWLKVETSRGMAQARRFYEKNGFVGCEVFGGYVGNEHSVCFEKAL